MASASSTVETICMIFPYLVNFYLQIQNPINLISMPTAYLESFGADLSENELFQCVPILLTGMSILHIRGCCLWAGGIVCGQGALFVGRRHH